MFIFLYKAIALVWLSGRGVRPAWVRIPLLPEFFKCLELGVDLWLVDLRWSVGNCTLILCKSLRMKENPFETGIQGTCSNYTLIVCIGTNLYLHAIKSTTMMKIKSQVRKFEKWWLEFRFVLMSGWPSGLRRQTLDWLSSLVVSDLRGFESHSCQNFSNVWNLVDFRLVD